MESNQIVFSYSNLALLNAFVFLNVAGFFIYSYRRAIDIFKKDPKQTGMTVDDFVKPNQLMDSSVFTASIITLIISASVMLNAFGQSYFSYFLPLLFIYCFNYGLFLLILPKINLWYLEIKR